MSACLGFVTKALSSTYLVFHYNAAQHDFVFGEVVGIPVELVEALLVEEELEEAEIGRWHHQAEK